MLKNKYGCKIEQSNINQSYTLDFFVEDQTPI